MPASVRVVTPRVQLADVTPGWPDVRFQRASDSYRRGHGVRSSTDRWSGRRRITPIAAGQLIVEGHTGLV